MSDTKEGKQMKMEVDTETAPSSSSSASSSSSSFSSSSSSSSASSSSSSSSSTFHSPLATSNKPKIGSWMTLTYKPETEHPGFICGDCGASNQLKGSDSIRCRECGYRVVLKRRQRRLMTFVAR
eukprot:TRINITY_DN183_c4_g1_i1.p1 TRINITY_DN183_c4_g1~~TRINITY_DN183_c4_g1_i1.p1  ORF type:complete len:124 (-),score=63.58 TRINITY_DN183_c4_g1_i1:570-941(-)